LFSRIWVGALLVPWDLASMQVYAGRRTPRD
jgi:hypothetical protein